MFLPKKKIEFLAPSLKIGAVKKQNGLTMNLRFLWFLCVLFGLNKADLCPSECTCANDGAIVDCSRQGLTRIPSNLPRNTVTL